MDQDQRESLRMLGTDFTTDEAIAALDWSGSRKGLVQCLRALGYETRRHRQPYQVAVRYVWTAPARQPHECACRCHTGTCGANDMVLAERAIRMIELLRPLGADSIEVIARLVDRAGVDFARAALPGYADDDKVPF